MLWQKNRYSIYSIKRHRIIIAMVEYYDRTDWEEVLQLANSVIKKFVTAEEHFLLDNISLTDSVLECGSGSGRLARVLAPHVKNFIGVDFSDLQLVSSKRRCQKSNVEFMKQDLLHMSFKNNVFDASLLMFNTLGNLGKEKTNAIREMARVTKCGGKIIVSVYAENAFSFQQEFYKAAGQTTIWRVGDITHADGACRHWASETFTKQKISKVFKEAGLKPKIKKLNEFSYIIIAIK